MRPIRRTPRRAVDSYDSAPMPTIGAAHGVGDGERTAIVAMFLVPDVEQRNGWREYYVREPERAARPIGFEKPGAR